MVRNRKPGSNYYDIFYALGLQNGYIHKKIMGYCAEENTS